MDKFLGAMQTCNHLHYVFIQLVQHVIAHLKPHTATVCGMYCRGFQDADPEVVMAAMDSAAAYVSAVADDKELMQLSPMIPPMLTIMGTCVGTDHDEVIVKGLDVLQECAANDQPLINEFIAVGFISPAYRAVLKCFTDYACVVSSRLFRFS
jgi:hypothetical protein